MTRFGWHWLMLLALAVACACLVAAAGAEPTKQDRRLARCMVYLPAVRDVRLRRWCLKQSEWMP